MIIDSADVASWGGQYVKNNAYFMVNIPVSGAIKVEYTVAGGGTYAVFVDTTTPTKWEIGVTAVLERVCIIYTEGVAFASKPANSESAAHHAGKATQYLRKLENGGTENWWPIDAAFKFAGKTATVCVVTDGVVQGEAVSGPTPTPVPAAVPASAPVASCGGKLVGGYCWYLGAYAASCTDTCSTHGNYNAATETYAGSAGTSANCQAVALAYGITFAGSATGAGVGCGVLSSNVYWVNFPPTTAGTAIWGIARLCACNN